MNLQLERFICVRHLASSFWNWLVDINGRVGLSQTVVINLLTTEIFSAPVTPKCHKASINAAPYDVLRVPGLGGSPRLRGFSRKERLLTIGFFRLLP